MPYLGISPNVLAENNLTNVQLIDDISSQFNGSTTTFNLTSSGEVFHTVAARAIFIVLGGVVQDPSTDYSTSGNQITFTTAPQTGLSFAGRKIYGLNQQEDVNDGTVTPAKLNSGAPSWDIYGNFSLADNYSSGEISNIKIKTTTPETKPNLDLNFERNKRLDNKINFSRSSIATYVGSDGLIKTVQPNKPRFDHDPITKESVGLLIEESRTNQMIYSSDITGDTAQNGTITGDATTAPDGTTTADKYAANSTNGIHRVDMPFTSGQISNSTAYTFSVFVKANGYDKLHIRYSGYGADDHGLGYDLNDGTTFAGKFDGTGSLGAVTSSSMIAYPNGWYRCSFTFTTASNATSGVAQIFYYISNSESTTNFAGDGSSGMYFWGAQFEAGSFPTSYISTSGTTVTRGGDNLDIPYNEFYNDSSTYDYASTFYAEAKVLIANQTNMIVEGYIGSALRDFSLNTMSGAKIQYVHRYTTTNSYDNDTSNNTVTNNVFFKTAMSYTGTNGGLHGTINGRDPVLGEDDLGSTSAGGDTMAIGRRGSNNTLYLNGHLKRLIYYPAKFTSNQLINLTK